jgi:hypothetical protein
MTERVTACLKRGINPIVLLQLNVWQKALQFSTLDREKPSEGAPIPGHTAIAISPMHREANDNKQRITYTLSYLALPLGCPCHLIQCYHTFRMNMGARGALVDDQKSFIIKLPDTHRTCQ